MKMDFVVILIFLGLDLGVTAKAQNSAKIDIPAYVERFAEVAVSHMIEHGIPASITLAQGILESAAGTSELATQANNHFGIKCHDWQGETYTYDDDAKGECFRKYADARESYEDHARFLKNRPRYAGLFTLDKMDYKAWAHGLKGAGYATLPTYAEKLIGYIEKYQLYKYDSIAWNRMQNLVNQTVATPGVTDQTPELPLKEKERREVSVPRPVSAAASVPQRRVQVRNGLRCVQARPGDTRASLAREFELTEWQIRRYNELSHDQEPEAGMWIYLEARHDQHPELKTITTQKEETWLSLASQYGVKSVALRRMNAHLSEPIPAGTEVRLQPSEDTLARD